MPSLGPGRGGLRCKGRVKPSCVGFRTKRARALSASISETGTRRSEQLSANCTGVAESRCEASKEKLINNGCHVAPQSVGKRGLNLDGRS